MSETKDYIRHRITLASHRAGPPFDKASYKAIYEYSRGIPRLINIACDRALLNAFGLNSFKITGSITREALRELTRKKTGNSYSPIGFRICGHNYSICNFYPLDNPVTLSCQGRITENP